MSEASNWPAGEPMAIAVGLVCCQGSYVIGERPAATALAGYWEFPGGKCRAGERPEECVARECREETGLEVRVVRLRQELTHAYPHGTVRLFFFDCQLVQDGGPRGEPRAVRAPFRWVPVAELSRYRFPEANRQVIRELSGG